MNLEERVTRQEENLAFQERLVEELNSALLEQQKQIKQLELVTHKQQLRLLELEDTVSEFCGSETLSPVKSALASEKPPHYK
ncbi:MAG: SlyX family protein [Deltaproteobacteria bacterium]|jgi:uncharacterized coiled-coil protein SlyX|nr:SlyX family protein [Deltaproteobacteria bacterium]